MSSEAKIVLTKDAVDIIQLTNDFPVQQFIDGLREMGMFLTIGQDSLCG